LHSNTTTTTTTTTTTEPTAAVICVDEVSLRVCARRADVQASRIPVSLHCPLHHQSLSDSSPASRLHASCLQLPHIVLLLLLLTAIISQAVAIVNYRCGTTSIKSFLPHSRRLTQVYGNFLDRMLQLNLLSRLCPFNTRLDYLLQCNLSRRSYM